jgi:hypothetical protein
VEDLEFFAKLGFLEITAGGPGTGSGVHLFAEATIALDEDNDLSTEDDRQFELNDLFSGALFDAITFEFDGIASAKLANLSVDPSIPGLNDAAMAALEISITIPDILNWSNVEVITQGDASQQEIDDLLEDESVVVILPDFSGIFGDLTDLSFENIIQAIRFGVELVESILMTTPIYDQNIPIINRKVSEAFDFIGDLLDKLEEAAEDPASALQEVENIIEDALGIDDNTEDPLDEQIFSLSLDGPGVLKLHIRWDKVLSDILEDDITDIAFNFNLGEIIGMFTGSVGTG